jgi:UDP-glucose 6-dehydrogenase
MSERGQRIAVFGAGYVGLVTGACFAELGHDVVVRDILPDRIAALRRGEVPIYEPGLEALLERNARSPPTSVRRSRARMSSTWRWERRRPIRATPISPPSGR